MKAVDIKQRINKFNQENPPFYIVDHEDGEYSLCLPLDMLSDEYYPYCQEAFDAYSVNIGDEPRTENGLKAHGSGYEWEAAFCEAFKDDPNIGRILFDCEAGGFFCYANDLTLLEDFGSRFKDICEDTERFIPIVWEGVNNAEARQAERKALMRTVKGRLMQRPDATFDIMTPDGNVRLTPEGSKALLDGLITSIKIDGTTVTADELLNQEITDMQTDLFDQNLVRLKTEEPEETMTMSM